MAAAVVAHYLGVDRIHLVASGDQRGDQQPAVGLDPDRHLRPVHDMGSQQRVQYPHPGQPIGNPPSLEHLAGLVQQAQVMVTLAQSTPTNSIAVLLCSDVLSVSRRRTGGGAARTLRGCHVLSSGGWHDGRAGGTRRTRALDPNAARPQHNARVAKITRR
jgi:hypothetical protein